MANFDIVSKYLIQHYPDDIARFTLGRDDVEVVEWLDAEQTTFQARRPDSLLRVRWVAKRWAFIRSFKPPTLRR